MKWLGLAGAIALGGCSATPNPRGADCAQDGTCPEGLICFPDFRCYPDDFDAGCVPACYGAEPFCDKATLRCIGCRGDSDCEAGSICAPNVQRCRAGCSATRPECPANSRCDLTLGICRGCSEDSAGTDPARPRCDVPTGLCVPCLPQHDDCPPGNFCLASSGTFSCVQGCATAADCGAPGPGQSFACCNRRCVEVFSSNDHCGACGNPCRNNDSCCNGVCVDLTRSGDNCGGCGRSCYLPNVTGVRCANSQCSNAGCQQYFGDCDQNLDTNGCEQNLSFSATNCGSCGHACTGSSHRLPKCILLSCGLGPCEAGWGDCDGNSFNGCETDLSVTTAHCGACNAPCATNQSCSAGQCR